MSYVSAVACALALDGRHDMPFKERERRLQGSAYQAGEFVSGKENLRN
jgi:hypothetical protein